MSVLEAINLISEMPEVAQRLRVAGDIHYMAWVEGLEDCRLFLDAMPCENAGIILNIGQQPTAEQGADMIARLITQADRKLEDVASLGTQDWTLSASC